MTPRDKLLQVARGELDKTEVPAGSNNTPYGEAYGLQGQPWCVIFLWWLFREAGLSKLFYDGQKTASCGTLLRWAKREGLTVPVDAIRPADIAVLNFSGKRVGGELDTEHCGLVEAVPAVGTITTIEGNTTTGAGNQSNGEVVARKTRYACQVVGMIRPKYETMDYVGHWAEDNIRWGIENGLLTGYEDGSYRPDKPPTRAEVITLLRRLAEGGNQR